MKPLDPCMARILAHWHKRQSAGMTLRELGEAMGFGEGKAATTAAHQFLKGRDPHVSSVRRFAKAMKVKVARLVE